MSPFSTRLSRFDILYDTPFSLKVPNAGRLIRAMDEKDHVDGLKSPDSSIRQEAWEGVFRLHRDVIYRVACRILGDSGLAEDVVQDTFIQVHRFAPTFRCETALRSWILTIAVNLSRRALVLRRARDREGAARCSEDLPETSFPGDLHEPVQAALANLSLDHRVAIVLSCVEELSAKDIAGMIGCSEGTVWSRIYYAKRELVRLLGTMSPRLPKEGSSHAP